MKLIMVDYFYSYVCWNKNGNAFNIEKKYSEETEGIFFTRNKETQKWLKN